MITPALNKCVICGRYHRPMAERLTLMRFFIERMDEIHAYLDQNIDTMSKPERDAAFDQSDDYQLAAYLTLYEDAICDEDGRVIAS